MVEPWLVEFLKLSPAIGAIVAIVYLGMKWHERLETQWISAIDKIDERASDNSDKFVMAIKDIGEKCHAAHDRNAQMLYEQSCKGQEVMSQVSVHMSHFARAVESLRK